MERRYVCGLGVRWSVEISRESDNSTHPLDIDLAARRRARRSPATPPRRHRTRAASARPEMVSIDTSAPSESCRPSIHSIACRSLHVPPGELPHRTHTIYTPTNTPPRGRWRPLSSRACSIGPMGGTGPRNTPHHALLAAFRLDLRSPDFLSCGRRPREVVQKSDFWGAP